MKTLTDLLLSVFISGLVFFSGIAQQNNSGIGKDSFNAIVAEIDWQNNELARAGKSSNCKDDFRAQFAKFKAPDLSEAKHFKTAIDKMKELFDLVEKEISRYKFNTNYLGQRREMVLGRLWRYDSEEDFLRWFDYDAANNRNPATNEEKVALKGIFQKYRKITSTALIIDKTSFRFDNGAFTVSTAIKPLEIESHKISWALELRVEVIGDCAGDRDNNFKIARAKVLLRTILTSAVNNYDFRSLNFTNASTPKQYNLHFRCCGSPPDPYEDRLYNQWDLDSY